MKNAPQKYVAHNPDALKNGCRSFSLNAFSSPWCTWEEIMREWMEAKGDPEREKVVKNTRFGESYRRQGAFEDELRFLRRREKYGAELPDGVLVLTAAVDTQDNRLEYEICGWGTGEECWGIKRGIILGLPSLTTTWQELDRVLDKTYQFKDGTGLKVARTFIDSGGHYTSAVCDYCAKNMMKQRFAIKGQGGYGIPLYQRKWARIAGYPGLPVPLLGVNEGKQMIMDRLAVEKPGPLYFHFPLDETPLLTDRGYDDVYFKGLISEHRKIQKTNGTLKEIWETTTGVRNEPLDLRNYNLAAMISLNIDWDKAAELFAPKTEEAPKPIQKIQKPKRRSAATSIW